MDPLLHTISLFSATAAGTLFSAIWEGTVLVLCVALCLRWLPGLSAAARSVVWMNVFLVLMLLHILPSFGGRWPAANGVFNSTLYLNPLWSVVIAGVWAMLSIWRGAQLVLSAIRLRGLTKRATPIHLDTALQTLLQSQPGDGKGGRPVEFCTSAEVERPSVFGFFQPRILLPRGLVEKLSALELRQVVLHEMEHLRRADDWTNLLQKVGLVLFPLNPVLLWVERRLCAERELACDDRVLHSTGARKAYAICLTRLAEYSLLSRGLSLVLGAWERQSELVRRVHRILRSPKEPMRGRQMIVLTTSLLLGVLAGAIVLARSPQLVSFAPVRHSAVQARSTPAPSLREMNVGEFDGSPTLVKAIMPRKPLLTPYVSNHRRPGAAKRNLRRSQSTPNQLAWVVLTEWDDAGPPPRLVIAVAEVHRSSYAAVAIADGWLIVQI
ncbi:MAG: M56 family metallopeptidase [Terracidiphilus sp.]|jgi:beta-lactamase regulating signal transducer with metallopeptidase domain